MIQFSCPECDTELEISDSKAGTQVTCPECEHRLTVPGPAKKKPAAAPPPPREANRQGPRRPPRQGFAKKKPKQNRSLLVAGIGGGVALCLIGAGIAIYFLYSGDGSSSNNNVAANTTATSGPVGPPGPAGGMGRGRGMRAGPGGMRGGPPGGKAKAPAAEEGKTEPEEKPEQPDKPELVANRPSPDPPGFLDNRPVSKEDIYQFVLKSTVLIRARLQSGIMAQGTGTLIDRTHKWVLTARHVVPENAALQVFFPTYKDGRPVTDKEEYEKQVKRADLIYAHVIDSNDKADLALLELDRLPDEALALPVARSSANHGQNIYTIGNPAGDTLWIYTPGEVRQMEHKKKWKAGGMDGKVADYEANLLLTTSPTNPGDSGGPLVNDRGELVGVVHAGNVRLNNMSLFIDVSEVLDLVEHYTKAHNTTWDRETRTVKPSVNRTDVVKLVHNLESSNAQVRADTAQALANIGPDARPAIRALIRHLKPEEDNDELTRRLCQEALEKIGAPDRSDLTFLKVCLKDGNTDVRSYAASALGSIGPEARSAIPDLLRVAKDREAAVRQNALRSLGKLGSDSKDQIFSALTDALSDPDRDVRVAAGESISTLNGLSASDLPVLREALKHQDPEVRAAAIRGLGKLGRDAKANLPDIMAAYKSPDKVVRQASVDVLARFGAEAKAAVPVFREALKDSDSSIRKVACTALAAFRAEAKDAVPDLAVAVSDTDKDVRKAAAVALGKIGPDAKAAAAALGESLKDEDTNYRLAALEALRVIGPGAKPAAKGIIFLFYENKLDIAVEAAKTLAKIGKDTVPDLVDGLRDNKAPMRAGAARALGEMGPVVLKAPRGREARILLAYHARIDDHPEVKAECQNALQRILAK